MLEYGLATKDDIEELIQLRIAYIIEMPANSVLLNGLYGDVLSVYTVPEYRGKGLCTTLMKNLIEHSKKLRLGRIDLKATDDGYPIYEKVGFKEVEARYRDMRYEL